ncbi:MAG TPA: alpha/beta hydrolase [Candidatus Methylomirabilis sp.]|nr:alpha/beta hydrolase [Candidatus Methylomirabilis sp.]
MPPHGIAEVRTHLAKLPTPTSLAEQRAMYDRAERVFTMPPGTVVDSVTVGGRPAEWIRPVGAQTDAALLYLHGGGYVIGSPRSHRHLAEAIARSARIACLLPDYRLAPEHPFPAAVDDALAAYRSLVDQRKIAPGRLAIAGDSAGGGLTVATLLAMRQAGLPMPGAAVCISPWTDLTCSAGSYESKAATDPMVARPGITVMAQHYLGATDARTPLASPLFADLRGLPPLLIHVGSEEVLLDDATRLGDRARTAGVDTTIEVWEPMIHVWHWFLPWLDEAQAAVDKIGVFLRVRLQ